MTLRNQNLSALEAGGLHVLLGVNSLNSLRGLGRGGLGGSSLQLTTLQWSLWANLVIVSYALETICKAAYIFIPIDKSSMKETIFSTTFIKGLQKFDIQFSVSRRESDVIPSSEKPPLYRVCRN